MHGVRTPGGVSAAPWAETQRQGGSRQGQPWTPRGQARLSPASHAARHPPGETILRPRPLYAESAPPAAPHAGHLPASVLALHVPVVF